MGFGNTVDSTSLSRANERRDYRIYEEFGYYLIKLVKPYYRNTKLPDVDVDNALFALDSTTISTSIKLATWALERSSRDARSLYAVLLRRVLTFSNGQKETIPYCFFLKYARILQKIGLKVHFFAKKFGHVRKKQ